MCGTQVPASLENSAAATGLEKVSFHSNPKERLCQRMLKLLYSCTHFTYQQDYAQNPSSLALVVCEPRISRCSSWIQKRQRNQRSIAKIRWIIEKVREFQNIYFCFIDYAKAFDYVDHSKLWKIFKEMGILDHLTSPLRNLYAVQETTLRTEHGTMDQFRIGKGVQQGCILSPCLFNLYANIPCKMQLDEAQVGIKIAGKNINNLRYTDDTTLMEESKE